MTLKRVTQMSVLAPSFVPDDEGEFVVVPLDLDGIDRDAAADEMWAIIDAHSYPWERHTIDRHALAIVRAALGIVEEQR